MPANKPKSKFANGLTGPQSYVLMQAGYKVSQIHNMQRGEALNLVGQIMKEKKSGKFAVLLDTPMKDEV